MHRYEKNNRNNSANLCKQSSHSLSFKVSWNHWRQKNQSSLKRVANIIFFSGTEGERQANLTHMSTVKQFRFLHPYSSSETMIYENVSTWKKKLIKNEKCINVEAEEFSGVTAFLPSEVSLGSSSKWCSLLSNLVWLWLKWMSQTASQLNIFFFHYLFR